MDGGRDAVWELLGLVQSQAGHSPAPPSKLTLYLAGSSLLICTCEFICVLMSVFLFSSLKQTNGYDGELYGSQSLNRRSGRVSIVNLHGSKFK